MLLVSVGARGSGVYDGFDPRTASRLPGAWPTLVGATYVAFSRIADNRHFLSDVVFGSALGIATGWTVVGRHGRENYAFVPVPVRGGIALTFTRVPRTAEAGTT